MGFLKKIGKKIKGFFKMPKAPKFGQEPRAQAAESLIRENVKRQAGAGQISFTEERKV